eukprot:1035139-Amphidinium_carterae.1
MTDMEKAQNEQRTNYEWKQLRLEKEQRLGPGYNRRKHGQKHISRFEDQYLAAQQRPAKGRGRGTGWQERQWDSSSSSSWQWSSDHGW